MTGNWEMHTLLTEGRIYDIVSLPRGLFSLASYLTSYHVYAVGGTTRTPVNEKQGPFPILLWQNKRAGSRVGGYTHLGIAESRVTIQGRTCISRVRTCTKQLIEDRNHLSRVKGVMYQERVFVW